MTVWLCGSALLLANAVNPDLSDNGMWLVVLVGLTAESVCLVQDLELNRHQGTGGPRTVLLHPSCTMCST